MVDISKTHLTKMVWMKKKHDRWGEEYVLLVFRWTNLCKVGFSAISITFVSVFMGSLDTLSYSPQKK